MSRSKKQYCWLESYTCEGQMSFRDPASFASYIESYEAYDEEAENNNCKEASYGAKCYN